ncbi:hypothetical protein Stube_57100 [Streptomyces tubercidicus]|uniref:Uncharacterized protein n=1 Tax=Streptomyces tubercidicus TaxID=47759 RepID=A0A640V015_9ACTN|nr:hypothetical protein Stube_57100 [Streptomyces tubercidicus]
MEVAHLKGLHAGGGGESAALRCGPLRQQPARLGLRERHRGVAFRAVPIDAWMTGRRRWTAPARPSGCLRVKWSANKGGSSTVRLGYHQLGWPACHPPYEREELG